MISIFKLREKPRAIPLVPFSTFPNKFADTVTQAGGRRARAAECQIPGASSGTKLPGGTLDQNAYCSDRGVL